MSVYPCNRSTYGSERRPTMLRCRNVAFTRWDPLRDLLALHEQIGQLVGTDAPGWTPPVDLYETADRVRPDRGTARPDARTDRHPRRGEPHRHPRRARRRPGPRHAVRAVSPRRARPRPLLARVRAARSRSTSTRVTADLKDGILTVTIPKAARSRRAPHRRQLSCHDVMVRRFALSLVLVVAGFVAGLVRHRPHAHRRRLARRSRRRAGAGAAARDARAPPRAGAAAAARRRGGGPDFTRVAGQAVKGVANISSLQVVRTPNSPFAQRSVLPVLLRRRRACSARAIAGR